MTRRTDNRTARLPVKQGDLPSFSPVPIKHRSDGWTHQRQQDFIEALADTGSVEAACKHVNMSTVGAYRIRRLPEGTSFAKAWDAALDLGVRRLEDVAMDRALNGVEEPFYVYGQHVGTRKKYNDRLLMFMLRNRSPERFGASANGASLKGLNAVGRMEKKRLKAKWRKQWEKEQAKRAKKEGKSPAEIRASIDAKIEGIRREVEHRKKREFERLSPETRRAFALYEKLRARDEARLAAEDAAREAEAKRPRKTVNPKPPPPKEPEPVKERKTVHTLKDESFEADRWV